MNVIETNMGLRYRVLDLSMNGWQVLKSLLVSLGLSLVKLVFLGCIIQKDYIQM
jgi:hypothetical protein